MRVRAANLPSGTAYEVCEQPFTNLLQVQDLTVRICAAGREFTVVERISFEIASGEIVGLLGESGCGKTTIGLSLLRLLPDSARVTHGSILFRGRDLSLLDERELGEIRGAEIAVIYQDSSVLNPVLRVGQQVSEVLRAHRKCTLSQARQESEAIFTAIGLREFDRIYHAYPHQLSGGQRQRIAIAQALICKPRLVIADEPIASVDQNTAVEILDLIKKLRDDSGISFLFISHDPDVLGGIADRMMVMYAGQIVESGPALDIYSQPLHPYTDALLQCTPRLLAPKNSHPGKNYLPCIPGTSPDPTEVLFGCSFSPRCRNRTDSCDQRRPEPIEVSSCRSVRCFNYEAR